MDVIEFENNCLNGTFPEEIGGLMNLRYFGKFFVECFDLTLATLLLLSMENMIV